MSTPQTLLPGRCRSGMQRLFGVRWRSSVETVRRFWRRHAGATIGFGGRLLARRAGSIGQALRVMLAWLAIAGAFAAGTAAAVPPNIVVIMADDLGVDLFDTLSSAGRLPQIRSRLIDTGIRFQNSFVTNPACCPSRATFLRGQYAHNHGVLSNLSLDPFRSGIAWAGWLPAGSDPGKEGSTIAVWLQQAGYRTAHIGKYLNGYGTTAPAGATPSTYVPAGWDDWQALIDPSTYRVFDYSMNDNGTVVHYGAAESDYQTDVLAARAASFIASSAAAGQQFFLVVAPAIPHTEVQDPADGLDEVDYRIGFYATVRPAPRHAHWSDGDPGNGEIELPARSASFNESDVADKPQCEGTPLVPAITYNTAAHCIGSWPLLRGAQDEIDDTAALDGQMKSMGAAMMAFDDLVGTVLDAIESGGVADRTVVLLTADNGLMHGEHRLHGKDLPYEESIRVPLVVRGPGLAANQTATQIVVNNDLAPTIAALAGVTPPYVPDGRSLVPVLVDPGRTDWHRRSFLVEHWFIPGLPKFTPPTFQALRSIKPGFDAVYVMWRANAADPAQTTHEEFYLHGVDPAQSENLAPNIPAGARNGLRQLIGILRGCAGLGCTAAERN